MSRWLGSSVWSCLLGQAWRSQLLCWSDPSQMARQWSFRAKNSCWNSGWGSMSNWESREYKHTQHSHSDKNIPIGTVGWICWQALQTLPSSWALTVQLCECQEWPKQQTVPPLWLCSMPIAGDRRYLWDSIVLAFTFPLWRNVLAVCSLCSWSKLSLSLLPASLSAPSAHFHLLLFLSPDVDP